MITSPAAAATSAPAAPPAPADPARPRTAPSELSVPALHNGSASAAAALQQSGMYTELLHDSLSSPDRYGDLVARGLMDDAYSWAKYAVALIEVDQHVDNDGFVGMVAGGVLTSLDTARRIGVPAMGDDTARGELADELALAVASSRNLAAGLATLQPTSAPLAAR